MCFKLFLNLHSSMRYAKFRIPWILQPRLGLQLDATLQLQMQSSRIKHHILLDMLHERKRVDDELVLCLFVFVFDIFFFLFLASQILCQYHLHAVRGKRIHSFLQKLSFLVQYFRSHFKSTANKQETRAIHSLRAKSDRVIFSRSPLQYERWVLNNACAGHFFSSRARGQWRHVTVLVWRSKPLQQDMNVLVFGLERRRVV